MMSAWVRLVITVVPPARSLRPSARNDQYLAASQKARSFDDKATDFDARCALPGMRMGVRTWPADVGWPWLRETVQQGHRLPPAAADGWPPAQREYGADRNEHAQPGAICACGLGVGSRSGCPFPARHVHGPEAVPGSPDDGQARRPALADLCGHGVVDHRGRRDPHSVRWPTAAKVLPIGQPAPSPAATAA